MFEGLPAHDTGLQALAPILRELLAQASALGLQSLSPLQKTGCEGQRALERLLAGYADIAIEDQLPFNVTGSRILILRYSDETHVFQALARWSDERRLVAIQMSAFETCVLLRPLSARHWNAGTGNDDMRRAVTVLARGVGALSAGVSTPLRAVEQVPLAAHDARDALDLAVSSGLTLGLAEDFWAGITLQRVKEHVLRTPCLASPASALADYDKAHGTEMRRSLALWLRHDRDYLAAAQALHVHVNTLRYRIKRAATLTGIDFADVDQRLALELLLHTTGVPASTDSSQSCP